MTDEAIPAAAPETGADPGRPYPSLRERFAAYSGKKKEDKRTRKTKPPESHDTPDPSGEKLTSEVAAKALAPKIGAPVIYTPDVALAVCNLIALGYSLASICALPEMPSIQTVFRWFESQSGFRDAYARARVAQGDVYADQIIDISNRSDLDPRDKQVRIDARKWIASKLKPWVYGDKIVVEQIDPAVRARLIDAIATTVESTRESALKVLPAPGDEAPAESDDPAGEREAEQT